MLLEQLVEKAAKPPEYDWDAYYKWFFDTLNGRDVDGYVTWMCKECMTVNIVFLPARYGKCRGCALIYMPSSADEETPADRH